MKSIRLASPLLSIAAVAVLGCPDPSRQAETQDPPPASEPSPPKRWEETRKQAPPDTTHGLDVSEHSGAVDWSKVAEQGFGFAFVKATEGVDLADPAFAEHWTAVKEAGLLRGAYHFFVSEDDPHEQARFFIDHVTLEPGDLAPVVDVELIGHDSPPGLADRLQVFLELLEAHYGVKPIIYTIPSFWDLHLTDAFGDYPLWVAEYDVESPRIPAGWSGWNLWQWRENVIVEGVEKEADLTRAHPLDPGLTALLVP